MPVLDKISGPESLSKLSTTELLALCAELRSFLISNISVTGGHLAANLGVVELTVALLRTFDFPLDKIVFDVGHQSYVYKILTDRKDVFKTLRQKDGICGFPRPDESKFDSFATGHASTSISAALGLSVAMRLSGDMHSAIAVIGDGALTGGLAFEGLNNAGRYGKNLIVILNDNEQAIDKNVGAVSRYLSQLTTTENYFKVKDETKRIVKNIPLVGDKLYKAIHFTKAAAKDIVSTGSIFEQFGFTYFGPIDGHDLHQLETVLKRAKQLSEPVFIHIKTQKGKGYSFAEARPEKFHGIADFNIESGEPNITAGKTFSAAFGDYICEKAKNDSKICAVTAAMKDGVGLKDFSQKYNGRCFDVGIAEGHAVTFAAGLAKGGQKPVVAVYSTFFQRAYDNIIHDVSLQKLPVIFAVDRAGLVGEDGDTHQGIFDVPMFYPIPNLSIYSPHNYESLKNSFDDAFSYGLLAAVRYPRGGEIISKSEKLDDFIYGYNYKRARVLFVTYGRMIGICEAAADELKSAGVIGLTKIKPIDLSKILSFARKAEKIVFVEETIKTGGAGEYFGAMLKERGINVKYKIKAIPDDFVPHGTVNEQLALCGLDKASLVEAVKNFDK